MTPNPHTLPLGTLSDEGLDTMHKGLLERSLMIKNYDEWLEIDCQTQRVLDEQKKRREA
jgi:hypothetical protein